MNERTINIIYNRYLNGKISFRQLMEYINKFERENKKEFLKVAVV
jgi:hypothetical protein